MTAREGMSDPFPDPDSVVADDEISIQMDKRIDLAMSIAMIAFGGYIVYLTSQLRLGIFDDPVGTRGLGYFTGSFILLVGVVTTVHRLLTWSFFPGNLVVSEGKDDDVGPPAWALRPFLVFCLNILWVLLLKPVGYLLITPPVLFLMLWLMGVRSWTKLIGFSVGFTLTIWIIFSQILNIIIPLGVLTNLARHWGFMY